MADEENKNSIVVAPEDESTCDKEEAEQETELSSILDKLSLDPKKEKQKKKLLVLSLSGLLLHRVHRRTNRKTPKNRSPDASCGPNLVYKRPFAEEFMKFILERFEVGIWSSACEKNVDIVLNIVLENLQDNLLFVWFFLVFFSLLINKFNISTKKEKHIFSIFCDRYHVKILTCKKKRRKMEEDNMECWSSPFINDQSSSNFIYPFHSFNNVSGTRVVTQGGPLHEHYYAPPAMVESSFGEASNTNNGYETKKKKMTNEQLKLLEISFQEEMKLDPERKMKLSKELGLQPRQIAVWFQNRKARWKNKQLEHLYESLRQEFDIICQEKKLLQEELIQLKAMIRENGASNNKQQTWENACSEAMQAQFQLN
ncbi:unnamed protein product [Brassica oleracea var. botrytis]